MPNQLMPFQQAQDSEPADGQLTATRRTERRRDEL